MRRSISGPIVVISVGVFFFLNNLYPDALSWRVLAKCWPFLLIGFGVIRLIEVFVDAGRAKPLAVATSSGGGFGFLVLACLVAFAFSHVAHNHWRGFQLPHIAPAQVFGEEYEFDVKKLFPIIGNDKRLVVEGLRGNVTVTGGDSTTVELSGHRTIHAFSQGEASHANGTSQIEVVRRGEDIVVQAVKPEGARDVSVSYDIEINVPRRMNFSAQGALDNVTVESIDGDLDVSGDSGNVRLTGIGGNVRVETARRKDLVRAVGIKGAIDLRGTGTDLQLEDVIGPVTIHGTYFGTLDFRNLAKPLHFESEQTDLKVEKLPGSISMDLGDFHADNFSGPFHLHCQSRDVHLSDFSNDVEIDVDRGDVELEPKRTPLAKITVHLQAGDLDLTIPEKTAVDLHANTSQGDVDNQYGDGIATTAEGRSASMKSSTPGGSPVTLTTQRGNITVKKG